MQFVACSKCNHILVFTKGKTDSSRMQKHKCCLPINQPVLPSAPTIYLPSISNPPQANTPIKKTMAA